METQATQTPTPLVRWKRAQEVSYQVLVRVSHCGLWKITKKVYDLPISSTTYYIELLSSEGKTIYKDDSCELLSDAKEACEEMMRNPIEFFGEDSPEAKRINARLGEILSADLNKGGSMN